MNRGDDSSASSDRLRSPIGPVATAEVADLAAAGAVRLVDAQAPGWFEREHLPGAVPVDWEDLAAGFHTHLPDRAEPLIVYCWNETCSGSSAVAEELLSEGYTDVRVYPGGKVAWQASGRRLSTGPASTESAGAASPVPATTTPVGADHRRD